MAQPEKIVKKSDGSLDVPDFPVIPYIEGDGIGPDIWKAARSVIDKAVQAAYSGKKKIEWLELDVGEKGFQKTGERLTCTACGCEYASEEDVPFKMKEKEPAVFTEDDRSAPVEVFDEGENTRLCRYCAHYIINPFTQFCAIHKKEVQATDSCDRFEQGQKKDSGSEVL